ncbi:MAG: LEA type 2 family protein [Geminicoccaceae bacterium]
MPPIRSCLAGLTMLGLVACASPYPSGYDAEAPDVSLAGLSFAEPGIFEQGLTIQLRVKNPNEFDIPIDGLNFALDVNDTPFAEGLSRKDVLLPSLGEIVVPIDVTITTSDLIERVLAVGTEKRLGYTLSGQADVGSWFTAPIPFKREGKLALPKLPGLDETPPTS